MRPARRNLETKKSMKAGDGTYAISPLKESTKEEGGNTVMASGSCVYESGRNVGREVRSRRGQKSEVRMQK